MPPAPTSRSRLVALGVGGGALVLLVATLLSITHEEPTLRAASSVPTTTSTSPTMTAPFRPTTGSAETSDSVPTTTGSSGLQALPARTSEVATVRSNVADVPVYATADGGDVAQTLDSAGDYGQSQVFLVAGRQGSRLEVLLPVRPNGSRGWIDADLVDVASHDYQIQVSLSGFRMLVQRGTEVVIDTAIGVGTQDTPTVGGDFYTWVLIDPTNAGYGSYAYGLSGFSTLEEFAGGDGRMGIHGTTDDSSIGRNVSHGCVRVPDDVVVEMVEDIGLPLGVPVTVLA
ncbi:MAG TPA: L,D-transpeptidase [Iamia sp.]|nr:L,D-transpeptidase [Iamia sp.]